MWKNMKGLFQNKIRRNINICQQNIQFYLIIQEYKDVFENFSEVISIGSDLDEKEISGVNRAYVCPDKLFHKM